MEDLQKSTGENLTRQERKRLKRLRKKGEHHRERRQQKLGKALKLGSGILAVVSVLVLGVWYAASRPLLPPTTMQGHAEQSPPSHILDKSIPENIQKHMLEHADGGGRPGVIVQYNCEKYVCEQDLVEKLTEIVKSYPDYVYLAPGPQYSGKIILTKIGRRKVLEEFDEEEIKAFIR